MATYLLMIGLFGTSMLAQTPYTDYYQILHPVTSSSNDGGGDAGCGGCGGGGGFVEAK